MSKKNLLIIPLALSLALIFGLGFYIGKAQNSSKQETTIEKETDNDFNKIKNLYSTQSSYKIKPGEENIVTVESPNKLIHFEIQVPVAYPDSLKKVSDEMIEDINSKLTLILVPSGRKLEQYEKAFLQDRGLMETDDQLDNAIQAAKNDGLSENYHLFTTVGLSNDSILSILLEGIATPLKDGQIAAAHPSKYTNTYNFNLTKNDMDFYLVEDLFSKSELEKLKESALVVSKSDQNEVRESSLDTILSGYQNYFFTSKNQIELVNIFDNFASHSYHIEIPLWALDKNY